MQVCKCSSYYDNLYFASIFTFRQLGLKQICDCGWLKMKKLLKSKWNRFLIVLVVFLLLLQQILISSSTRYVVFMMPITTTTDL